jgi:predicted enzyme related to lactoylglutathione lyase
MKLKSAAGTVCYVRDISATVDFYKKLGFTFKREDASRATAYINWWWVDFHQLDAEDIPAWHVSPKMNNADLGALLYFSVDNVQTTYDELVANGVHPATEPYELRGNKEFVVIDPDGYRLVMFKRK